MARWQTKSLNPGIIAALFISGSVLKYGVCVYTGEELRGISDNWISNRGMYMQTNFGYQDNQNN